MIRARFSMTLYGRHYDKGDIIKDVSDKQERQAVKSGIANYDSPKSTDYTVKEALEVAKTLDEEQLEQFKAGDERSTIEKL